MKKVKSTTTDLSKMEILKQGRQTEFWKIITDALEESKEDIQKKQDGEDIAELTPEMYKFRNELFKAKKQMIDKFINTPDNMIEWYTKPVSDRKNFDPYATDKE